MKLKRVVVVGGGAAGFFGAIHCAQTNPRAEVILLERGSRFLSKVLISGGGRCNVTHACFDPRLLSAFYPRGNKALIGPFHRFQPRDTVAWFEERGVELKTEADGRMFPVTDSSETIANCLLREAADAGVELFKRRGVESIRRREGGGFDLETSDGARLECESVLLAAGGCRAPKTGELATSLGHTQEPAVPSLFTFHIEKAWVRELSGLTVETAEVAVADTRLRQRGAVLFTHWGLSGPAILRLSAWGARVMHDKEYRFSLAINWLPDWTPERLASDFQGMRRTHPAKLVANTPVGGLPSRLWKSLVNESGISTTTRWSQLPRAEAASLTRNTLGMELPVTGKSLNKEEFVTCGGIRLNEVNFKTMESRLCPGLYFAGEVLDIDGITGGFNFQAAWTTASIAGQSIANA